MHAEPHHRLSERRATLAGRRAPWHACLPIGTNAARLSQQAAAIMLTALCFAGAWMAPWGHSSGLIHAEEVVPLHARIDARIAESHAGPVAELASDQQFVRRVYLDFAGRVPSIDETRSFLASTDVMRRPELIERLVSSAEFNARLATLFDVMWMERRLDQYVTSDEWRKYLEQAFARNTPLDILVAEILSADGDNPAQRPAAKFYLDRDVESHAVTRDVSRMFLGRDIQCAQCHDHPLIGDYHQSEYYGIFAFLSRSYRFDKTLEKEQKFSTVAEKAEGEAVYISVFKPEVPEATALPSLLNGLAFENEMLPNSETAYVSAPVNNERPIPRVSRRAELARLLTDARSQSFNENCANRLWRILMKRGLVEPPDLIHSDNPAIYPLLLTELGESLAAMHYDVKAFLKEIALSDAYQRSMELPTQLVDSPGDVTAARAATLSAELQIQDRVVTAAEQNVKHTRKELVTARQAVLQVRSTIQQQLATRAKKLQEKTEAAAKQVKLAGELAELVKQAESLRTAHSTTQAAVALRTDDKELSAATELLKQRVDQANQAVGAKQAESDGLVSTLKAIDDELAAMDLATEPLREQHSRLALAAKEAGGAYRATFRRYSHDLARQVDLQNQLKFNGRLEEYAAATVRLEQLASVESQARQDAEAESEAAIAALADAERSLRLDLEDRLVVAGVQGLSPEQLAASTISALRLLPRLRAEAIDKWKQDHADRQPEDVSDALREQEVEANLRTRLLQIEKSFVNLYGNTPGSPQDTFQATVDQALYFDNDGQIQSWLAPAHGSLAQTLLDMKTPDDVAQELYLSVFSRWPTPDEVAVIQSYWSTTDNKPELVRDLIWSLLTSVEFRFAH